MLHSEHQDDSVSLTDSRKTDELTLPVPEDSDELTLIAYLDDELSSKEKERLEQRLQDEPKLREKLSELDQTWDVLNFLDSQTTEPDQVCKTLQIIAQRTEQELHQTTKSSKSKVGKSLTLWGFFALLLLVAACVGYFSLNSYLNRSRQQTLDDLLLIERMDQYMLLDENRSSNIDEVEFLKKLYESEILE